MSVLGPTEPPVQWVTAAVSPEIKRSGGVANCWPPFRAEMKNRWICTSTHPCVFMAHTGTLSEATYCAVLVFPCLLRPLYIVRLPAIRVSCIINTDCEAAVCSDTYKLTHRTTTAPTEIRNRTSSISKGCRVEVREWQTFIVTNFQLFIQALANALFINLIRYNVRY